MAALHAAARLRNFPPFPSLSLSISKIVQTYFRPRLPVILDVLPDVAKKGQNVHIFLATFIFEKEYLSHVECLIQIQLW